MAAKVVSAMPPLPTMEELPALQLRMVQAEIAALQQELGL